jgi:hypothetical protein
MDRQFLVSCHARQRLIQSILDMTGRHGFILFMLQTLLERNAVTFASNELQHVLLTNALHSLVIR